MNGDLQDDIDAAAIPAAELATRRFGLMFVNPRTERRYDEWRVSTALPFARIGYIGSIPSWAAFLAAIYVLQPAGTAPAAPAIAAWIAFLFLLTGLTLWHTGRRLVMPLAALANCLAGLLVSWLLHDVVSTSVTPAVRAGIMAGGVLIVMYFGFAIFRLTPRLAIAGVTPYLAFSLNYLYVDFRLGTLGFLEAGAFTAIELIAFFGGVFVCAIIELFTRRSFVKDQIIQFQQRQLSDSRDAIRRYVPPTVAERIIQGETDSIEVPKRLRVTVLFADIVGFTDIADRVEPEVMTEVLNDYMSAMAGLVDEHGGTLNEFAGDGLMALFGAPQQLNPAEQAHHAISAALAMQAMMPKLNDSWRRLGLGAELSIRIGMNTGMVSVGSYGSQGRMTYTAIGLQTNIAARIEAAAAPGQILISNKTYQFVHDEIPCEPRGEVECKGVHYPVQVFTPVPGEPAGRGPSTHSDSTAPPTTRAATTQSDPV